MPETERTPVPASQRPHNKDRMRRSCTWLEGSRREGTEDLERFAFLRIAFNAAYGDEPALRKFVERKEGRDSEPIAFGPSSGISWAGMVSGFSCPNPR